MILRCFFGHRFQTVEVSHYKFDPVVCVDQRNPFALTPCPGDDPGIYNTMEKKTCRHCGKTIIVESL